MATKRIFFSLCFVLVCGVVLGQDIIVTKNARRIEAKVTEVGTDNIRYKSLNNLDGPDYVMSKKDISSIIYKNGIVELFETVVQKEEIKEEIKEKIADFEGKNDFLQLNDDAQEIFLKKYDIALYEKFRTGQNFSYRGKNLFAGGMALSSIGLVLVVCGIGSNMDYLPLVGLLSSIAGDALITTSIPFSAVGGAMKKKVQDEFQKKYLSTTTPEKRFQINLSGNGIGLAYVF